MSREGRNRPVVVGIGTELCGDDAAGLEVARSLAARGFEGIETRESSGETASLLDAWDGAPLCCLVDATAGGVTPGTIRVMDLLVPPLVPLPHGMAGSHSLGLEEALQLGAALGRLPRRLVLVGIEGSSFALGTPLSPAVAGAVGPAADAVQACMALAAPTSEP